MIRTLFLTCGMFLAVLSGKAQKKAATKTLNYKFYWDGKSSFLSVDVLYYASKGYTSRFHYGRPEIGNQQNIFRVLRHIRADKNDILSLDSVNREIAIKHKFSGLKKLHYEINGSLISPAHHNNANEQFRPQIAKGCFYALGFNIFLEADSNLYKAITIKWAKYPPKAIYFTSINPVSKPAQKITINADEAPDVYMAMENKLIIKAYHIENKTYYAITSGRDTVNDMQKCISPFFKLFFPAISDFWKDKEKGFYFLSLIPFLNNVSDNLTGYGLTDGFSMRYKGRYDIKKIEVIAHETSHRWIGNKLTLQAKGMEHSWFDEGFNDYVDTYILAETKMLSQSDFINYINEERLIPYYRSPARNAPADSVQKYFWTDHNYEYLPYQRGFIYAFYLDNQIRLTSSGRYTIRDFLIRLLAKRNSQSVNLTVNDFIETCAEFLPKTKVVEEIRRYMQNGELIDFHNVKLIKAYCIKFIDNIPTIAVDNGVDLGKELKQN